jgi:2,5-dioxopentanoate dehydrogenase
LPEQNEAAGFVSKLQGLVHDSAPFHLLTQGIQSSYRLALVSRRTKETVKSVADADSPDCGFAAGAALFETNAESFMQDPDLATEIFGPSTLLVRATSRNQLLEAACALEGHLTATIHGTDEDLRDFSDLLAILKNKVGRLIFNGFPTGVEVTHAMVHGGPYPATSDGRSTSVGSRAIERFVRPICYQGFPQAALPAELQNENPLRIWRMVDGEITKNPVE